MNGPMRYAKDPVLFLREVLDMEPDDWQVETAMDVQNNSKIAVKSGQGVGKTAIEAGLCIWFLCCRPYARVVCTAPTMQQLYDVLWAEIAKWLQSSKVKDLLTWTKTKVYMNGDSQRWFATAKTATKPENMQGFHEDHMLFIVDEASGVADPIMEAIIGTLTGVDNKLLMMGNPNRTSGTFYDAFTANRSIYVCRTVSSRTSSRTSKENIADLERKYGKDSNVVRVRVDGEFPTQEDDVFIPMEWIEGSIRAEPSAATAKAMGTYYDSAGNKIIDRKGIETIDIGCDVARFGDDKTCIGYKVNEVARMHKKVNGQDTTWTAGTICQLYKSLKSLYRFEGTIFVKIDDGGVGGGVTDQLKAIKRAHPAEYAAMEIVPIHFGAAIRHKNYYDTTTYMMAVIREMIQPFDKEGNPRKPALILPDDPDLVGQLSCRKYGFYGAKQKVESKKEMKDRGLRSPDEADCIILTCYPTKRKGK